MDQNTRNKLMDKIEKLLALSGSDNIHEANLAMERAMKIAVENNIELSEVVSKPTNNDIVKDMWHTGNARLSITQNYVTDIIAKFFDVSIISGGNRKEGRCLFFIGKKDKIEFAKYLNSYLNTTFSNLWQNYYDRNRVSLDSRKSFFNGIWSGLKKVLTEVKASAEATMLADQKGKYELMVMSELALREQALTTMFHKVTHKKGKSITLDRNVWQDGFEKGGKISIHSGLTNG
jgi:hypothetical protein